MFVNQFLLLGAVLFCIGVYGVLARKNAVMVLMSVELILNSVNINLLAFTQLRNAIDGNTFALYIIAVAAAEVGVGLAMVLLVYRNRRSIALSELSRDEGLTGARRAHELRARRLVPRPRVPDRRHPGGCVRRHPAVRKRLPMQGSEVGIASMVASLVLSIGMTWQWIQRVDDVGGEGGHALGRAVGGSPRGFLQETTARTSSR
jgi:NADH:ubiquinone oxidoreductase subunit K